MLFLRARWSWLLVISVSLLVGYRFLHRRVSEHITESQFFRSTLNKETLAQGLGRVGIEEQYPTEVDLPIGGVPRHVIVQYAFSPKLQAEMSKLFHEYRPDYGAFVAVEPKSGRVLSMVSYVNNPRDLRDNLAIRATFPSASVFKLVTAAAAIAERNYSPDTVITFNGRNHTLYRSNILRTTYNRWVRQMTLKQAFANSVNTVFGKIGAFTLGADRLRNYADRFGFNRKISADLNVQEGHAPIHDDPWQLAESASGYTRENTMSPLQGALIAASIVNDGVTMEPFVVQSVYGTDGSQMYEATPRVSTMTIDAESASELRSLMRETVRRGTSRGSFRGFFRGHFSTIDVGGKTGSLTGSDPAGRYDWFVGYGDGGRHQVAVAALTINKGFWRVKSSYLARRAIESYFKEIYNAGESVASSRGP